MSETYQLKSVDLEGMGRRIRAQREAIRMTRKVFGQKLGVTQKFISDIEYGDKGMSIQTLYKMTQVLNLSADYILRGEPVTDGEQEERIQWIKENIMGPLSNCNEQQLKCMEQISRSYVEGIIGKG